MLTRSVPSECCDVWLESIAARPLSIFDRPVTVGTGGKLAVAFSVKTWLRRLYWWKSTATGNMLSVCWMADASSEEGATIALSAVAIEQRLTAKRVLKCIFLRLGRNLSASGKVLFEQPVARRALLLISGHVDPSSPLMSLMTAFVRRRGSSLVLRQIQNVSCADSDHLGASLSAR